MNMTIHNALVLRNTLEKKIGRKLIGRNIEKQ